MFTRYHQLLAQTRASYSVEKAADERRSEIAAYLIYRPLSFYLTPVFLAARWSADAVTLLQFALAATMPCAALLGGIEGAALIAGVALLMQILDCVDGNIARVTGFRSVVGNMLDGMCTLLFWAFYFIALGVLTQATATGGLAAHGRELGLALAVLLLGQRSVEDAFAERFDDRVRWTPPRVERNARFSWAGKLVEQVVAFGGVVLAAAVGWLEWLLGLIAVYQSVMLLMWLPRFAAALRARMRQPRVDR